MTADPPRAVHHALAALPVLVVALALYARTLLPDVGLWDTAEFQAIGPVLGTAHPTGYPTYTMLAWLASVVLGPFGNEAYRADLLSALLMAGAAALLAVSVVQTTRRWPLGIVAGLVFAVTPVVWKWGLRADPHALHVFLAALMLVLLGGWATRRGADAGGAGRWLIAAAIVYGLSLGNHALTLLLAPGIAVYVLLVTPRILWQEWRLVIACVAAIGLAAVAVYLYLPLRAAADPALEYADPGTWDGFWYVVLGEQFRGSVGPLQPLGVLTAAAWDELVRGLGLLSILAAAGAILGLARQPRVTALSLLWFGGTWLLAVAYPNAAIERYYLVPVLMAALWVALAADALWDTLRALLPGPGRATARRVALGALVASLLLLTMGSMTARYDDIDASHDTWGRDIVEAVFGTVEEDAVVVSWWSFSTPLWYGQHVEGRRPDITVIDDRDLLDDGYGSVGAAIEAHLGARPVYLIRHDRDIEALRSAYELERISGVPLELHRVLGPAEAERGDDP